VNAQQAPANPSTSSQASASTSDLQEVVVTGFRASLQTALDAKRSLINLKTQQLRASIQLVKALGGGWQPS